MATNFKYASQSDLTKYFNRVSDFDSKTSQINVIYGEIRAGDIPHSLASIEKGREKLKYNPKYSLEKGLKESVEWYWKNL